MKRFVMTMALASALAAACTTTHQVRRPASGAELESLMPRQRDRVTLLGEPLARVPAGPPLTLAAAARSPLPEDGPVLTDVSKLRGYEVKNRGRGALEGLGLGILFGALAGAVVGSAFGSDQPCNGMDGCYLSFSATEKASAGGLVGALAGSVVGPLLGFAIGHTNQYLFASDGARP